MVEDAELLGVVQEGPGIDFEQVRQFRSLLRFFFRHRVRRRIGLGLEGRGLSTSRRKTPWKHPAFRLPT